MTGSHINKVYTHEDEQPVIADLLSQEDQDYDDRHDQQLMTHEHDTCQGHHNPSNQQSNTSVDYKLATSKDESFPPEAMKNGDITDIMDELGTMKRPPNLLESSISESTLHRISRKVMKQAIEDKKVELKQSGTKIPAKDVDILRLIDTLDLYGLINDSINKYNDCNTIQGFINNMIGNTNTATGVKNNYKTTTISKSGKSKPVVIHENNNGAMKLADTGLKSKNTFGAHLVEEKEEWFYKWADKYDMWND